MRQAAADAAAAQKAAVMIRRAYGPTLREHFLDQGLDIRVEVRGSTATTLYLKFALFNDVWVHNFRKGTLLDEVQGMGFKRVDFDDGYDYHTYVHWD